MVYMVYPMSEEKKPKKKSDSEVPEKSEVENEHFSLVGILIAFGIVVLVIIGLILFKPPAVVSDCDQQGLEQKFSEALGGRTDKCYYTYNGFTFVEHDDLWNFQVKRKSDPQPWLMRIHFGPKDVEDIPIEGDVIGWINMVNTFYNATYLTFDPEGDNQSYVALATAELVQNWAGPMEIGHILACTRDTVEACNNMSIVSCENATAPTVYLKQDTFPKISRVGMCVTVQGLKFDMLKSANRFIYMWYGIMD